MMFYRNPLVFMSIHPVAYIVKLNIEMSMASLIRKIATSHENDFQGDHSMAYSLHSAGARGAPVLHRSRSSRLQANNRSSITAGGAGDDCENMEGKLSDDA